MLTVLIVSILFSVHYGSRIFIIDCRWAGPFCNLTLCKYFIHIILALITQSTKCEGLWCIFIFIFFNIVQLLQLQPHVIACLYAIRFLPMKKHFMVHHTLHQTVTQLDYCKCNKSIAIHKNVNRWENVIIILQSDMKKVGQIHHTPSKK